jgi:hypothetical protein
VKLYTIADVCRSIGWDPLDTKYYQRVWVACGQGHAGDVLRTGRGFVLTADNKAQVVEHLRERWPGEVLDGPAVPRRAFLAESH